MNRRAFLTHCGAATVAAPLMLPFRARAASQTTPPNPPVAIRTFLSRLQPAVAGGGFELRDYWVWCGAPAQDQATM